MQTDGGQISQSDLQKAVSIDPVAVTRHVQQLEAEGILLEPDARMTTGLRWFS